MIKEILLKMHVCSKELGVLYTCTPNHLLLDETLGMCLCISFCLNIHVGAIREAEHSGQPDEQSAGDGGGACQL